MSTPTLDYIRTATTVAKFLMSKRLEATVTNIRSYFGTTTSLAAVRYERRRFDPRLGYSVTTTNSATVQFMQPQEVAFIAKLLTDPNLLDDLAKDVDKSVTDVCEILNRILDRNEDEPPTDYLGDQWEVYRCQG